MYKLHFHFTKLIKKNSVPSAVMDTFKMSLSSTAKKKLINLWVAGLDSEDKYTL